MELGAGHAEGPNPALSRMPDLESQGGTQKLQIVTPVVILLMG